MSAQAPDSPSISSSGYADGLGRREIAFDRETGTLLERLHVRPEIGVFDLGIAARVDRLQSLDDERFARPLAVERDAGRIVVVSEYVAGVRVSDLLEAPDALQDAPTLDLALAFLLEALPALQTFHAITGGPHGLISAGRTVLTSAPHVVFLDAAFGEVIGRLHYSRARLWREFGLALPPSAGPSRFTVASDISQVALTALMLVLGRTIRDDEYPNGLSALVSEVSDVALIRGSDAFAAGLQQFLNTALPISGQPSYRSAQDAVSDVRQIAELEMGVEACHRALTQFIEQIDVGGQPLPAAAIETASSLHVVGLDDDVASELSLDETPSVDIEQILLDTPAAPIEQEISLDVEETPATFDLSLTSSTDESFDASTPVATDTYTAETYTSNTIDETPVESFSSSSVDEPAAAPVSSTLDEDYAFSWRKPTDKPSSSYREPAAERPIEPYEPPPATPEPAPSFEERVAAFEAAQTKPVEEPAPIAAAPVESALEPVSPDVEESQEEPEPEPARTSLFSPRRKKDDKSKSARARKDRLRSAAAAFKESVISRVTHQPEPKAPERAAEPLRTPEPPAVPAPPPPPPPKPVPSLIPAHRAAAFEPPVPEISAPPPRPFAPVTPPVAPPAPAPVVPAAAAAPPPYSPPSPPMPVFNSQPISIAPPAPQSPPIQLQGSPAISLSGSTPAIPLSPSTPALKLKTPVGLATPPKRPRVEPPPMADMPRFPAAAREDNTSRSFPWKLAIAGLVLIIGGAFAGRAYLMKDREAEQQRAAAEAAAIAAAAKLPPARRGPAAVPSGRVVIDTQPAGAKVLMDGLAAGQTPLTLDSVPAGKHTVTLISDSGSVKRAITVKAGDTVTLNEQIFGGWVAIFAPITFEVSEKGRAIGNTEEGRIMLSPGRHELTLTNKALGYSAVHSVEIQPGEVLSLPLEPKGRASFNALPWAEVWIEDKKIGDTPLTYELPLGVHNVVFKNPQYGERKRSLTIKADAPATLSEDFNR